MTDQIIGVMWCRNEGDILAEIIDNALNSGIDALMVADDDSTDDSWNIIKSYGKKLEYSARRELTNHGKYLDVVWARQHLLDEVRSRFGYKNTWVQIIESDVMLYDTDIREVIKYKAVKDTIVYWHMLNAVRKEWTSDWDSWPNWGKRSIKEVMPDCHWMEVLGYTFRPLPKITYLRKPDIRKPYPQGFSKHYDVKVENRRKACDSPLLMHYGYRGPSHFYGKMKGKGRIRNHPDWMIDSVRGTRRTVPFFNGAFNNSIHGTFPATGREEWIKWLWRQGRDREMIVQLESLT